MPLLAQGPGPALVENGIPSFTFIPPELLGIPSAPLALHEMPDGRILMVGPHELIIGDGIRWELQRKAEDCPSVLKNVAISQDGSIFTGIPDGFARITYDADGRWRTSRVAGVPLPISGRGRTLENVTQVPRLWLWHGDSGPVVAWDPSRPARVITSSEVNAHLFAHAGLLYLSNTTTGLLQRLADERTPDEAPTLPISTPDSVTCSAPFNREQSLVGTVSSGLMLFDGTKLSPFGLQQITQGRLRINDLCQTAGGHYAAAIDSVGIVIFAPDASIVMVLDHSLDVRLARINKLLSTKAGDLWALGPQGIVRINFPTRLTRLDHLIRAGISFVEPSRLNGKLWLLANGRTLSARYDESGRIIALDDLTPKGHFVFTLKELAGRLIASSDKGLLSWDSGDWKLISAKLPNTRLLAPTHGAPLRWIYARQGAIGWIDFSTGDPTITELAHPQLPISYGAIVDATGIVWLELGLGRVARLDPGATTGDLVIHDRTQGVPENWVAFCLFEGMARLVTDRQFLLWDATRQLWIKDTASLQRFPLLSGVMGRPIIDTRGRLWITGNDRVHIIDTKGKEAPETLPPDYNPTHLYADSNGCVWIHDAYRFSRYDPALPAPRDAKPTLIVSHLEFPASGRVVRMPGEEVTATASDGNAVVIHCLSPGGTIGQSVSFETRIDSLGEQWLSAGSHGSTLISRLRDGNHKLSVRAVSGTVAGEEVSITLRMLPPWYRSTGAYVGCGVGLTLLLGVILWLPIRTERLQQEKLRNLVASRTQDLRQTNEQLRLLVDETRMKAAALHESEERYRQLSMDLEKRVAQRTEELRERIAQVETLNNELHTSQAETEKTAACLQEVNANLMVANQELESFSYSVSHDLRAPLRNITGFMELLGKRVRALGEKESDRYLDIVISEAKRMADLIDDLLTFSRVGRTELKLQEVRLDELLTEVRRECASELRGRSIDWRISPLPPAFGDRNLVRQALVNLVSNAVKFTRKQPDAIIEIGAKLIPGSPEMVVYHIRDNGAGFNPQYIEKLFRVFQRLHTPRDFEGTGIGLANVKRIITRHGGRVWAEGAVNQGATFYFTLKSFQQGGAPATQPSSPKQAPASPA